MKICYVGPALDFSGYGEANRHDIGALYSTGAQLKCVVPTYVRDSADFGELGKLVRELSEKDMAYYFKILHTTPDQFGKYMEDEKYHIGRVFWETDKLPPDFAESAEKMDEIWTGSEFNKEAIIRAGVSKPVHIIPEAIDVSILKRDNHSYETEAPGYKFYSIFEWTERKNPRALLKAYWQEFKKEDKVSLTLKIYIDDFSMSKKRELERAIYDIKHELNLPYYAPVYIYRELMDRHQIYRFHRTFDCFVSAHRGEGWGIPQMEAMLLGNPIISTALGGIHEYLTDGKNALLVNAEMIPIAGNTRNDQWYRNDQHWGEVNLEELQGKMRWIYENQAKAKAIGKEASLFVQKAFSMEAVGKKMYERLTAIEQARWDKVQ